MCHNPLRYLKSLKSKKNFAVTKSPTTDLQFENPLRYHQRKNHRKTNDSRMAIRHGCLLRVSVDEL